MELLNFILSKEGISLLDSLLVIAIAFEGMVIIALAGCIVYLFKRERECTNRFIKLQSELIRRGVISKGFDDNTPTGGSGGIIGRVINHNL